MGRKGGDKKSWSSGNCPQGVGKKSTTGEKVVAETYPQGKREDGTRGWCCLDWGIRG